MSTPSPSAPAAFSRGGVLALALAGFALLFALLYLIGAGADLGGDTGGRGEAHASANGLNGFSGLARLTEAQGYTVRRSRSAQGLKADGLLVLTPGFAQDPEELRKIFQARRNIGPTLVIMPKWIASAPPPVLPAKAREKFKRGWVVLDSVEPSDWPEQMSGPFRFEHKALPDVATSDAQSAPDVSLKPSRWRGLGVSGALPEPVMLYAVPATGHDPLITDDDDRVLAYAIDLEPEGEPEDFAVEPVALLAEPDLANNYGLADPARAAVALALIDRLTHRDGIDTVTFDLTLNGFGASENLLTLAFRPPFLAATLSLLVALLIVGWRAFMRFGPAAASGVPDIAFGKRQLIVNGASLILRARRFGLLARPYAALSARRLAERLGLARPDPEAIDAALARRLPQEEPFTRRAARLEAADKPAAILAAARALDELASKLTQGPPRK